MYDKIITGGRYFTLKKNIANGDSTITISVSDPIEMVKEFSNCKQYGIEKIKEYCLAADWSKALHEASLILVEQLMQMGIFVNTTIDVDNDAINFDLDFDYTRTIKVNNNSTIFNFTVRRHGWNKFFIVDFIKTYNENVEYKEM